MKKKILKIQRQFQCLRDWTIHYRDKSKYKGQCVIHPKQRIAIIFGFGKKRVPNDYLLHEILHCAVREIIRMDKRRYREQKQAEEILIQDICKIWRRRA